MSVASPVAIFDRALEYATKNLSVDKILIALGLDPTDITYDAIFNRLLELALANLTFSNILALVGGIFLLSTFVVRTIVLMRVLCVFSIIFFLGSAALAGSLPKFLLYLLALPINVIRLIQIRNVVKKARIAARGTLSLDWLKPFMIPRNYKKGDVLFRKGDAGTEMFLTVSGKFLVTEIGIEIPPGRMLGELGFISPTNQRTQSVECVEDGDVLTITYERLLEIYFQNSEFGYFFLRLVSDRLLQNLDRLEGLIEQDKAKLQALAAGKSAP
jgi:Cyclic nucleotide-binding domain